MLCGLVCACLATWAWWWKVSGRTWQGLLTELVLLIGMITWMNEGAPLHLHLHFCKDRLQRLQMAIGPDQTKAEQKLAPCQGP